MTQLKPLCLGDKGGNDPIVIAGPCSAESRDQLLTTATRLHEQGIGILRAGIWKPRTMPGCFEGVGSQGLEWLAEAKALTGMLTATEVATPRHVREALDSGVDILWIGARTTANPFAVQELADTLADCGRDTPVLVKNPVNPDLDLWIGALMRLYNAGLRNLGAVHRGFSSYGKKVYRNPPEWNIPVELRRRYPQLTIVCDPSHIGGRRDLIAPLAQQAYDMGMDGLIIESHCTPDTALSDKDQQVTPERLGEILKGLTRRTHATASAEINLLRDKVDTADSDLLAILAQRMEVCRKIGEYKKQQGMPVLQTGRYDDMVCSRVETAQRLGLSEEFVRRLLALIHKESVRLQLELYKKN